MKKFAFIFVILLVFTACKKETQKVEEITQQTEEVMAETPLLAIAEFDTKAGDFVNKEVKVQGIVDHVCKHGGKKLLLATDDGKIHVTWDERFDESLKGSEVALNGVVAEEIIDEAYCLKLEEDNIKSHSEGQTSKEQFEAKKGHIKEYRELMKASKKGYLSNYSLEYVSHVEVE